MKQPLDVAKTARRQLVSLATPLKLILLHIAVTTLSRRFQTMLGLKEQRLQGGHDANGAAVVPPGIGLRFRPEIPKQRWVELENDAPTGRTTPEGAVVIAVSMTGGQDFRPEHPDPRHSMHPARNAHRGRRRRGAIASCRTRTKPARRRLCQPKLKSSPPEGHVTPCRLRPQIQSRGHRNRPLRRLRVATAEPARPP